MIKEEVVSDKKFWNILIVDDDVFIHKIIAEINKDIVFENRTVKFHSAFTIKEAEETLKNNSDIAVVLIDIFLEEPESGPKLARYIRETLANEDIRIVLITGQGSRELEEALILNYDINGYENKDDLFSKKMNTVILSALRSYRDIRKIKSNKGNMEKVMNSMSIIYKENTIEDFLKAALFHLNILVGKTIPKENNSFVAIRNREERKFKIIAGTGTFKDKKNEFAIDYFTKEDIGLINKLLENSDYKLFANSYVSFYRASQKREAMIYVEAQEDREDFNEELLDIFHKSLRSTYDSICVNAEIEETQREIVYILGELTEARAEETGFHVKRVSKYCELLGRRYGLSEKDVMLLTNSAPMHDIGKIAIPDNILLKPGKLTEEEFNIMKSHTRVGYNLLKSSDRDILKAAAIVSHEHHEKYNGTGYPRGLKGEDIHIFGRITAVADVFDALGTERVYKKAWPIEDILKLFQEERGQHFDPEIVDILFENIEEVLAIREKYSDGEE